MRCSRFDLAPCSSPARYGTSGGQEGRAPWRAFAHVVQELRKHGVTLHMLLETERQPIPDVPAVYYVQPSEAAVARIVQVQQWEGAGEVGQHYQAASRSKPSEAGHACSVQFFVGGWGDWVG